MHSDFFKQANLMREKLGRVSPSFCLAKWKQVTIHLYNGQTHSCHHPVPHAIPLAELGANPTALHNTTFKKEQRRKMLAGERPKECEYCWNIEDAGDFLSDRHFKSGEAWAQRSFDEIASLPWDANVLPSYVEVAFSNQCNFRCSYCSPQVSSRWLKEIREDGPYTLEDGTKQHDLSYLQTAGLMPYPDEESNPYVRAFWEWWPTLYPALDVFRITGGEPLLSKSTFRVLEWIAAHPRPELRLAVNSNLGVPDATLDRFIQLAEPLRRNNMVRDVTIYTSVDSSGAQAEYIRNGLDYDKLMSNIDKLYTGIPGVRVVLMCTFNALSVTGFRGLLEKVLELRRRHSTPDLGRLWLDIAYLRYPPWQNLQILTPDFVQRLRADLEFMRQQTPSCNLHNEGFQDAELEKFERMIEWASTKHDETAVRSGRRNFHRFFSEHDRRRGTSFPGTFPEMKDFWNLCETETLK